MSHSRRIAGQYERIWAQTHISSLSTFRGYNPWLDGRPFAVQLFGTTQNRDSSKIRYSVGGNPQAAGFFSAESSTSPNLLVGQTTKAAGDGDASLLNDKRLTVNVQTKYKKTTLSKLENDATKLTDGLVDYAVLNSAFQELLNKKESSTPNELMTDLIQEEVVELLQPYISNEPWSSAVFNITYKTIEREPAGKFILQRTARLSAGSGEDHVSVQIPSLGISDFAGHCIIGLLPHERETEQELRLQLQLTFLQPEGAFKSFPIYIPAVESVALLGSSMAHLQEVKYGTLEAAATGSARILDSKLKTHAETIGMDIDVRFSVYKSHALPGFVGPVARVGWRVRGKSPEVWLKLHREAQKKASKSS